MNLPVTSTSDYLRHVMSLKRVKFDAFFLRFRDNILNNRDQREAWKKGQEYRPRHHEAQDLLNKRVVANNDRYSYGKRAEHNHEHIHF